MSIWMYLGFPLLGLAGGLLAGRAAAMRRIEEMADPNIQQITPAAW